MALTKVAGDILDPGISIAGIVTATAFDGPFRGGSDSDIIAGIGTFTELDVNGNADFSGNVTIGGSFTVQGDYTTLNTTLRNVELLRVSAASTFPAGIVTQTGTGDILNLFDGTTEVFTVLDGGNVGIGSDSPTDKLNILTGSSDEVTSFKVKTAGQLELSRNHSDAPFIKTFMSSGNPEIRLGDSGGTKTIIHGHGISYFNGGNVGIGETEPDKHLHISNSVDNGSAPATIRLTDIDTQVNASAAVGLIEFETLDSNDAGVNASIGAYYADTAGASNLQFHVGNAGSTGSALTLQTDKTASFYGGIYQALEDTSTTWASRGNPIAFNNVETGVTVRNSSGTDGCFTGFSGVAFNANSPARWQTASFLVKSVAGTGYTPEIHVTQRTDANETTNALTIDTNQKVLLGHTSAIDPDNYASSLQVTGTNTAAGISILRYGDNSAGPTLLFGKSRGANIGGFDKVDDGDDLGKIEFYGTDTGWESSASIRVCADGDWYSSSDDTDSPGRIEFHTTPNGADQLQERLCINSSGHILPGDAGTQNLGSATKEWADLYFANSKGLKLGSGQVGDLYNDGTDTYIRNSVSNGQTLIRSGGDIWISDYAGNHRAAFRDNSAVDLYFDIENHATAKLSTTATGVSVHGEVAATQDYPNYRPTLDLNFAAVKKLDPRITYQRTGPASFVNEFGIVQLIGDNTPRFDHDPVTKESKGLLIEEARTNQITDSYDLTTSTWSNSYLIRKSSTTETRAPNGKYEATKISLNTSSNQHYTQVTGMTKANGAERQCVSFWAKLTSSNYPILASYITGAAAFTNYSQQNFNLSTGVVTSGGGGGFTNHSAKMTQYPNGWWKCEYEATLDSSETTKRFQLLSNNGSSDAGNGTDGYYLWGVQVEVGGYVTSHIPTDGSTATRGLDLTTIEGTDFSDIFDTDFKQFSMLADYDNTQTDDGTNYSIIDLWGESTGYDDRIEWFKDNASPYHIETRSVGQSNATFANGALSASSKAKSQRFATSWYVPDYSNTSSRRFVVSMGGEAVDVISDSSGTTVPQLTRLGIGCNPTRLDFSGGVLHFKRLMFYNRTLSDGQLQNLSS